MDTRKPIEELGNRTWEELEVVEHPNDGMLLFRDKIRKRTKSGGLEEITVRVCVVRSIKLAEARAECRQWFVELKLDFDRDRDIFDELEQVCIMARAIRDDKAPYGQIFTAKELASDFDEGSLLDINGRIQAMRQITDPRETNLTDEQLWSKIFAVVQAGNLLPLTDIAGHEQPSFVVFTARQAMSSPMGVAWLQSRGISTPEP